MYGTIGGMKSRILDGPKLAAVREDRGLTVAELAQQVGCSVTWINELEAQRDPKRNQPSLRLFRRITEVLNVHPDEISHRRRLGSQTA